MSVGVDSVFVGSLGLICDSCGFLFCFFFVFIFMVE